MKVQSYLYHKKEWNKPLPTIPMSKNSVLFVFGNNQEVLEQLWKKYEGHNLVGSMTSGNIYNGSQYEAHIEDSDSNDASVTFTWVQFKNTTVDIKTIDFEGYDDSFEAGQKIFQEFNSENLSGMLLFAEGLKINGAKMADGITSVNKKNVPIIGGLAADNMQFKNTRVYWKGGFKDNAVVAVAFYGDKFNMVTASRSGMTSFGVERKITKSDKNVLITLDDKPALDVYESFLGNQSSNLPASGLHFPIEISSNFSQLEGLLRTPFDINRELKTITFTGEIPEGQDLRFMLAQIDSLNQAAEEVGQECLSQVPEERLKNSEFLAILISCAGRKAVLSSDLDDEISPSYEQLGSPENNHIGFYSYGEFVTLNNKCSLVNQTMSQVIFYEEE